MSAKFQELSFDEECAAAAQRRTEQARRERVPPPAPARFWVSQVIGFDSRIPGMPAGAGNRADPFDYESMAVDVVQDAPRGTADFPLRAVAPRSRTVIEPLHDSTIEWMARLPQNVQPHELARLFPRIANKLCNLWVTPGPCNDYLISLLMDSRDGARAGFPMAVAAEMAVLMARKDDSATRKPWDQVRDAR